jgi:F420H(2)-dependent quinone reductase
MALLPPRWFIRSAWRIHRALLRLTDDRVGLSLPRPGGRFGMLRLTTTGRHSGRPRSVVLGFIPDGDRYVTLAMNGWAAPDPAWWLNLQADPRATVDLPTGSHQVTATAATAAERERLWTALHHYSGYGDLDALAVRRGRDTAVVILTRTT